MIDAAPGAPWAAVDWSRPWLTPWRPRGEPLATAATHVGVVAALNAALARRPVPMPAGPLRFVAQADLPAGEPYEAFIDRTASVPTRDDLHDFFNGLAWLHQPAVKRRLNGIQAAELRSRALVPVPAPTRGVVRDAATVFDENGAWLRAPPVLQRALQARDWTAAFVDHRAAWREARLALVGHALLEKLVAPRKDITAHVVLCRAAGGPRRLTAEALATKPWIPLQVLGVPGWWPANEAAGFYDDPRVFRPARQRKSGQ